MVYKKPKYRKYSAKCVSFGFIDIALDIEERPQYLLHMQILSAGSLKLNKLKREIIMKEYILSMAQIYLYFL
jgi:hypothetical protein